MVNSLTKLFCVKRFILIGVTAITVISMSPPTAALAVRSELSEWAKKGAEELSREEAEASAAERRKHEEEQQQEVKQREEEQKAREAKQKSEEAEQEARERSKEEEEAVSRPSCVVPRLRGDTLNKARVVLLHAHCRLGKVSAPPGRHRTSLIIVSQSIRYGSTRPSGELVGVTLGRKRR